MRQTKRLPIRFAYTVSPRSLPILSNSISNALCIYYRRWIRQVLDIRWWANYIDNCKSLITVCMAFCSVWCFTRVDRYMLEYLNVYIYWNSVDVVMWYAVSFVSYAV